MPNADSGVITDVRLLSGIGKFSGVISTQFGYVLRFDVSPLKDGEADQYEVLTADGDRTDMWDPNPIRSQPLRLVRKITRIEISVVPAVALFFGGKDECQIHIENRGNSRVQIGRPQLPYGYELVDARDAGGFPIDPGNRYPITIRRTGDASGSTMVIKPAGGDEVSVELLPAPAAPVRMPPGFVIAIDFGTSNTSVFCLETRTGNVEAIGLMGDQKDRRETILYAPADVDPRYWQAIKLDGIAPIDYIRNLKTLLRDKEGDEELSRKRLQFYLKSMLRNGIESYLAGRNPDDERSVEFVFTVPVLEGEDSPQHISYRETLLEAARSAGYEDIARDWSVRAILEPDGGALDVISNKELTGKFTDRELMLVVDIGGGTTDVTLGRIRLTGTRPRLEEIENVAAMIDGEEQFGGEIATYRLGWRWARSDAAGVLPTGPDEKQQWDANQSAKTRQLVDYGWVADAKRRLEAESSWTEFDEEYHYRDDSWARRFGDLWIQMRSAKHHLTDEAARFHETPWKVPAYEFDSKRTGSERLIWRVPVGLLDHAVETPAKEIAKSIQQFLDDRNVNAQSVRHVAIIGGSGRLERVRSEIESLFPKKILPPGDYMDVAVCRGATLIHQAAPPVLPVGFALLIHGKQSVLVTPGASLAKVARKTQELSTSDKTSAVEIKCILADGRIVPYMSMSIERGFAGEISAMVSSASIRIAAKSKTGALRQLEVGLL